MKKLLRAPVFYAQSFVSQPYFIGFTTIILSDLSDDVLKILYATDPDRCYDQKTHQLHIITISRKPDEIDFAYSNLNQLVAIVPSTLHIGQQISGCSDLTALLPLTVGYVIVPKLHQFAKQPKQHVPIQNAIESFSLQITKAVKYPKPHPMRKFFSNAHGGDPKLLSYEPSCAALFYKALAAGHSAYTQLSSQCEGGTAKMSEVNFQEGNIFCKFVNLTDKFNRCDNAQEVVKSDCYYKDFNELAFLLEDVQLLSHCCYQMQFQEVQLGAKRPMKDAESPFERYSFDYSYVDSNDEVVKQHQLSEVKLMQTLYSSGSPVAQFFRNRFKEQFSKIERLHDASLFNIWLFLVKDKYNCFAIIRAVEVPEGEDQHLAKDSQLEFERHQKVSYPSMKICQPIFGNIPEIDVKLVFQFLDCTPATGCIKFDDMDLLQPIGISFFEHSLHWAISGMQSNNHIDNRLQIQGCNELALQICSIFNTSSLNDSSIFNFTNENGATASDFVSMGVIFSDMDQQHLCDTLLKYSLLSQNLYHQLILEIIEIIIKEMQYIRKQRNQNLSTMQLQQYETQLISFATHIVTVQDILKINDIFLYQLALTAASISGSYELLQTLGIQSQENYNEVNSFLQISFTSQVDDISNNNFISKKFNILVDLAINLLQSQQVCQEIVYNSKFTFSCDTNFTFYRENLSLFLEQGFSQHIYGKSQSEYIQKYQNSQLYIKNELDSIMLKQFQESGIVFTNQMLQNSQIGKGNVPITFALLVLNFDENLENLETLSSGQPYFATKINIPDCKLDITEFDDSLEEFIELPGSQYECWCSLSVNARKLKGINQDIILAYQAELGQELIEVQELQKAVNEAKKTISSNIVLQQFPIQISYIANVCGVRRLLFQSTIVIATTRLNVLQQPNFIHFHKLDQRIRTVFEHMIQQIVNNQLTVYENGFLTLNSNIQILYKYQISQDIQQDLVYAQNGLTQVDGKSVSQLKISQFALSNNLEQFLHYNKEQSGIIVGYVGAIKEEYMMTQTEINPSMIPLKRVLVPSSYYIRHDNNDIRRLGNGNITSDFNNIVQALSTAEDNELRSIILKTKYQLTNSLGVDSDNFKLFRFNISTGLFEEKEQVQLCFQKEMGFSPSQVNKNRNYQQKMGADDPTNCITFVIYYNSHSLPKSQLSRHSPIQYVRKDWLDLMTQLSYNNNQLLPYIAEASIYRMNLRSFYQIGNFLNGQIAKIYGEIALFQKQLLEILFCLRGYGFVNHLYNTIFEVRCDQQTTKLSLEQIPRVAQLETQQNNSITQSPLPNIYRDGLKISVALGVDLNKVINYLIGPLTSNFNGEFNYPSLIDVPYDIQDFVLPYLAHFGDLSAACERYVKINQIPNRLLYDNFVKSINCQYKQELDTMIYLIDKRQEIQKECQQIEIEYQNKISLLESPQTQFDAIQLLIFEMIDTVAKDAESVAQLRQEQSNLEDYFNDLQLAEHMLDLEQTQISHQFNISTNFQQDIQKNVLQFRDFSEKAQQISIALDEIISLQPVLIDVAVASQWASSSREGKTVQEFTVGRPHPQFVVQHDVVTKSQNRQDLMQGCVKKPVRPNSFDRLLKEQK